MASGKGGCKINNFGGLFFWFKPVSCVVDNTFHMASTIASLSNKRPLSFIDFTDFAPLRPLLLDHQSRRKV